MDPVVTDHAFSYAGAQILIRRWMWLPSPSEPRMEASRVRVEVISTTPVEQLPKELFVWERHTVFTEGSAENKDRFLCVAKVSDLSVYPVNDPDLTSKIPPFYRSLAMDVPFSSPEDLLDTWEWMKVSLQELLETLVKLELVHVNGS
jgi:hypothetical protein